MRILQPAGHIVNATSGSTLRPLSLWSFRGEDGEKEVGEEDERWERVKVGRRRR
jgi:hypothetical protein